MNEVYPRTHGETRRASSTRRAQTGLSPYTRGNLHPGSPAFFLPRSIPVHTGKPGKQKVPEKKTRGPGSIPVHTGKPSINRASACDKEGLSPYTRGNQLITPSSIHSQGSIPVHTGKPFLGRLGLVAGKVYPRTHGETRKRRCISTRS